MKIIDLLNKIANGEEVPKKIKVNKILFEYQGDDYLYKDKDEKEYWLFSTGYTDKFKWLDSALNTEVEIIEENKIPKKLTDINADFYVKDCYYEKLSKEEIALDLVSLKSWINFIIDYLKSKGE